MTPAIFGVIGRFGVAWRGKAADADDAKDRAVRARAVRWLDIVCVRKVRS